MKKLLIFILGMILCINVFAGTGWTGAKTILELEGNANGTEIRLVGFSANGACTGLTENGVEKTWARVGANQENREQIMSIILTAFASGRSVDLYCANAADWANLTHVRVAK